MVTATVGHQKISPKELQAAYVVVPGSSAELICLSGYLSDLSGPTKLRIHRDFRDLSHWIEVPLNKVHLITDATRAERLGHKFVFVETAARLSFTGQTSRTSI